eukprot:1823867-Pleurochrysis_carterae.AAC.2
MYTCRYLGAAAASPLSHPSVRARSARAADHLLVAPGGGCDSSNARCAACADAATSVDTRSIGAYAPPNHSRMSITISARPSSSHHTKHCNHHSARCSGQKL